MLKLTLHGKITVLVLISFFFLPNNALASGELCASGWGRSVDNGTWTILDTVGGKPRYQLGSDYLVWSPTASYWAFTDYNGDPAGHNHVWYYSTSDVSTPESATSWNIYEGDSPSGTITTGVCSGGGATTTPSVPYSVPSYFEASSTCTSSFTQTASGNDYITTGTTDCTGLLPLLGSSATSSVFVHDNVNYGDWLLVSSLILFMVAFIPVTALFSLIKKR